VAASGFTLVRHPNRRQLIASITAGFRLFQFNFMLAVGDEFFDPAMRVSNLPDSCESKKMDLPRQDRRGYNFVPKLKLVVPPSDDISMCRGKLSGPTPVTAKRVVRLLPNCNLPALWRSHASPKVARPKQW
jgi:hypothetical protein